MCSSDLPVLLVGYGSAQSLWEAAAALFAVGLAYLGVLTGLSTVVQLRAPAAYRGRVLSLYLVALGVAYPVGALAQGPVVDRIGVGWTTTGTAVLLGLVLSAAAALSPGTRHALFGPVPVDTAAGTAAEETVPADSVLVETVLEETEETVPADAVPGGTPRAVPGGAADGAVPCESSGGCVAR